MTERQLQEQAVEIARLQERAKAAEAKADAALASNDRWMANANEWRGFINDLRADFVTREELNLRLRTIWAVAVTLVTVGIALATLVLRLTGGAT